jgi:poly(A) polymerase
MAEPRVVPRAEHPLSRRDIDPDALKVLYRLRQAGHVAYLVGGSVRDLLLGRRPKDFDIGTSAHPYQVKKLFRNCWIIGRRFRLAHVRFGPKVIEVATFRRQAQPGEEIVQDGVPALQAESGDGMAVEPQAAPASGPSEGREAAGVFHPENTFGTPEEDAFRRDFTINALFYDIATFSVIDYVHGMEDLSAGIVRSIGDPGVRFQEDPIRMLRAIALGARLDFAIDRPILDAITRYRHEIGRSSPARLLEELYKILRSGVAEKTFRRLFEAGLLESISGELHRGAGEPLWRSLGALDTFRAKFTSIPETFTNPVLLGGLLTPLGAHLDAPASAARVPLSSRGESGPGAPSRLGAMPLARRDLERLRQILGLQRRLRDLGSSPRFQRALTHRSTFREALSWLEIYGNAPDVVEHWISVLAERGMEEPLPATEKGAVPFRRRRRRRRRHRAPRGQ